MTETGEIKPRVKTGRVRNFYWRSNANNSKNFLTQLNSLIWRSVTDKIFKLQNEQHETHTNKTKPGQRYVEVSYRKCSPEVASPEVASQEREVET